MECVTSATISFLVNGIPNYEFKLSSWLYQGDPLSPFVFLIAAKCLTVMLNASVRACIFTGYGVSTYSNFRVSHLQFANVTLLLAEKS